ncbi:hypothetical protein A584_17720 [Pseudomonas syringae pv. theae ICMP 3923]|uniref:Uncharacterized protein n=1 Tax=Pseudomonas syringae pv. theae TaxID=103985 RepID=A0A0Q0DQS6_PSESX|nr:ABC-three component system middle component 1 [Pseudomonas syringae]EPM68509.1 hypothetical protein A584_17720 [Pseudomonas syringae pv. theae ICMP 3923]KPZ31109.1 hypothetical protein AN901_200282 [Pseudomonas syringae pv. theae]MBL3872655.1 hypothetical protein [Pseudomonas syringae pv. theae]RMT72137.1 hypothetical protein ALP44_03951 [Pseudomonas syringae pv. theae]GKQ32144.1 hypothetical protein PSTH68_21515 [Pseudomonas syringae pv. theae]
MLIEIMQNIFTSNGFRYSEIKPTIDGYYLSIFLPPADGLKQEYFVVIEGVKQSEATTDLIWSEIADNIFEKIRTSQAVEGYFAKNCTLILCCEKSLTPIHMILKIEEDPYNFKKNVITYTKGEITSMNQLLMKESEALKLSNHEINLLINGESGNHFTSFKERKNNVNTYYSLLLKIMTKLPFITYEPGAKFLHNLESDIEKELTKEQTQLYTQALAIDLEMSEEKIQAMILKLGKP